MKKRFVFFLSAMLLLPLTAHASEWKESELEGWCNPVVYQDTIVLHDGNRVGLGEYTDSVGYYEQMCEGSFSLSAEILESEQIYTGFMIREYVEGDDKCIYFGLDKEGKYQLLIRGEKGGKLVRCYVDKKFSQMDYKYFKMIRDAEKNLVVLKASADGKVYETAATARVNMPESVHIGFTCAFKSVYGSVKFVPEAEDYTLGEEGIEEVNITEKNGRIEIETLTNCYTPSYDIYRSKNGGEYELVAENVYYSVYTDKALDTARYRYKCYPSGKDSCGAESEEITIEAMYSVSENWNSINIGNARGAGRETVDAENNITLYTSGEGKQVLYYNADSLVYVYLNEKGDGDYMVKMTDRSNTDSPWGKVGLQLRETKEAKSIHLSAVNIRTSEGTYCIKREETGGETYQEQVLYEEADYLRIKVTDRNAEAFASNDGENWTKLGSLKLESDNYCIGLFNADESGTEQSVSFDLIKFTSQVKDAYMENSFRVLHNNVLLNGEFVIINDRIYAPAQLMADRLETAVEALPVAPDDNSLVPLRETVEAMGGTVIWYNDSRAAVFTIE